MADLCTQLVKFYARESQADFDRIDMERAGWSAVGTLSWSEAAKSWRQEYTKPESFLLMSDRMLRAA